MNLHKLSYHSKALYSHPFHRIRNSMRSYATATPPPPPSSSPEPESESASLSLQSKRKALEALYFRDTSPMSGKELKILCKGKQLRLGMNENNVILKVYSKASWEDASDEIWDSMAGLITDWCAELTVREAMPLILSNPSFMEDKEYVIIPLKVYHQPPPPSSSSSPASGDENRNL